MSGESGRMRLDVWLWRARFFKTRTLAATAVEEGGMRIERDGQVRRIAKASAGVAAGDILSFAGPGGVIRTLRIVALPLRRGPAPEAAAAFEPVVREA